MRAVCPASIDMVDIMARMKERTPHEVLEAPAPAVNVHYEREERLFDPQPYTPLVAEIIDIFEEARGIKRFTVRYRDRPNQGRPALRGQFFMLTVFGAGEIAISVPFSDRVKDAFTFYVKKVGKVTTAMHNLKVGDMMGLRGPFGVPLPYETLKGRDLLVVGSGVGHAPVRATLVRAKPDFGRIAIMASASTYDGLLLKDDLREWAKVPGVEVHYSLSKPTDQVDAHIGYINDLLPGLGLDWRNTSAIICACGLSYLGMGIQPPTPEWGLMISAGRDYLRDYWHIAIIPGLAIVVSAFALNMLGDGLRDALDPRLKQ